MDDNYLNIKPRDTVDSLSVSLQKMTLHQLQHLSGKRWTNFNVSDSGLMIGDVFNYALSEIDYKLGFNLIDYLTPEQTAFIPEKYGMYLPEEVYPTTPVTLKDYQTLFLSSIPELDAIKIELSSSGSYIAKYAISPLSQISNEETEQKIKRVFHANRNLCEMLEEVRLRERSCLYFHSEFEILSGQKVENILAQIYWEIMSYLNGNLSIKHYEELESNGLSWEDSLDGTICGKKLLVPQQANTMEELRGILSKIDGVKEFKTCYLAKSTANLEEVVSEFTNDDYQLFAPQEVKDFKVKISIEGVEVGITDLESFKRELNTLYLFNHFSVHSDKNNIKTKVSRKYVPKGRYRDVFHHRSIFNDLPAYFNANLSQANIQTKNKQLEVYLSLFDLIMQRGLKELAEVKNLLSIDDDNHTLLSKMRLFTEGMTFGEGNEFRDVYALKNQYLNFLDHLYGVDSYPFWLRGFYDDGEDKDTVIKRRIRFLSHIPFLTQTRSRAYNMFEECSEKNIPTIKLYLLLLLDMTMDGNLSVGRFSPGRSLEVVEDIKALMSGNLSIRKIDEETLELSRWESIQLETSLYNHLNIQSENDRLLNQLDIFSEGKIGGFLFREGTSISNYYIVPSEAQTDQYILVFKDLKDGLTQELMKSDQKDELKRAANLLRDFLVEQNRQSEIIYILEHQLFGSSVPAISFVFSARSIRFTSLDFRAACQQLIETLLPAHIKVYFHWLNKDDMKLFEGYHKQWTDALLTNSSELGEARNKILEMLKK